MKALSMILAGARLRGQNLRQLPGHRRRIVQLLLSVFLTAAITVALGQAGLAQYYYGGGHAPRYRGREDHAEMVARGKYLVTLGGCTDCHTPGSFFGKPDMSKYLGGSDVGFAIPGLGIFVGSNLTPDKTTGLGNWTTEQIVTAFTTGKLPNGRSLGSDHALPGLCASDKAGCASDRLLPPESATGLPPSRRTLWAD